MRFAPLYFVVACGSSEQPLGSEAEPTGQPGGAQALENEPVGVTVESVCADCALTIDWSSLVTWDDGTPVDPTAVYTITVIGLNLTVDEIAAEGLEYGNSNARVYQYSIPRTWFAESGSSVTLDAATWAGLNAQNSDTGTMAVFLNAHEFKSAARFFVATADAVDASTMSFVN